MVAAAAAAVQSFLCRRTPPPRPKEKPISYFCLWFCWQSCVGVLAKSNPHGTHVELDYDDSLLRVEECSLWGGGVVVEGRECIGVEEYFYFSWEASTTLRSS